MQEGKLQLEAAPVRNGRATFHDPCYLGRYEGVYEAPRDLIRRAGFDLVELRRNRKKSFCCGGGSAGFMREQEEERRVDQERKEEIAGSGARTLVTACPECKMMLDAAVEETVDLAELIAGRLAGGDPAAERPA